jgi:hypothetical protein
VRIRFQDEDFECSVRAHAWQAVAGLTAVDGTIEMVARSTVAPARRSVLGFIHGRLERPSADGPFVVPVGGAEFGALLAEASTEWKGEEGERPLRFDDARWRVGECRVPDTGAPRYAGKACDILEARFALGSQPWMQDWPLEVSDVARLGEFCAYYDEAIDALVRFDVMQLALFSLEYHPDTDGWSRWFERTLRRDFALHGHTIAYWAALELEADDPELGRDDPETVFPISRLLREVWEDSLVPVESRLK